MLNEETSIGELKNQSPYKYFTQKLKLSIKNNLIGLLLH